MAKSPRLVSRNGISLLEVLVSIFILAIGISSVFALFLAGRELDARAAVQTRASAYLDRLETTLLDRWTDIRQWQYIDPINLGLAWADGADLPLPIIVDPYALAVDSDLSADWGFNRFVDLRNKAGNAHPEAFQRVTLSSLHQPSSPPTVAPADAPPLSREAILSVLANADDLEFEFLQQDPNGPPRPAFDVAPDSGTFLRRKRGSDLTPAVFLAQNDSGVSVAEAGTSVDAWLLVFHKFQLGLDSSGSVEWPQGSLRFEVFPRAEDWLRLEIEPEYTPHDPTPLRRAMSPGKWLLLAAPGTARWRVHWSKMTSVTADDRSAGPFDVLLETPYPSAWASTPPTLAFAFDSLVMVSKVAVPITIHN